MKARDGRAGCNPVFNDNRLKLGIFAMNLDGGESLTTVPERWRLSWAASRRVARLADQAGLEALVPVARWKGFGGLTNFGGTSFETYAWAAGLADATQRIAIFATSHVPTVHPVFAAKQGCTIDHIAAGRFGVNVVCGWSAGDLGPFGAAAMDHDTLYEYADEWLQVVKRIWTSTREAGFQGRFFRMEGACQLPKPVQRPHPALMNAGSSLRGRRFAAQHCDLALVGFGVRDTARLPGSRPGPGPEDYEDARARVTALRDLAAAEFHREIQVWTTGHVVCRPTEREALDYVRHYALDHGDWQAADNRLRGRAFNAETPPDVARATKARFMAGSGGGFYGTPEQVAAQLVELSHRTGLDGVLLNWVDYEGELRQFCHEVLPHLEAAGLRRPVARGTLNASEGRPASITADPTAAARAGTA